VLGGSGARDGGSAARLAAIDRSLQLPPDDDDAVTLPFASDTHHRHIHVRLYRLLPHRVVDVAAPRWRSARGPSTSCSAWTRHATRSSRRRSKTPERLQPRTAHLEIKRGAEERHDATHVSRL